MSYGGVYRGVVADTNDPQGLGRVRLQVVSVYGTSLSGWAPPMISAETPAAGTVVMVMFIEGSPDAPVWLPSAVSPAGAVMESDYDANTILAAAADNTPLALTMGPATILARLVAGGIVAATPAQLRTLLDLVVGTNVQAYDPTLAALAGTAWSSNSIPIGTGVDTLSMTSFNANSFPARASTGSLGIKTITDFGLSLVDDANAAAALTTLGLGAAWTSYTPTNSNITVGNGTCVGAYIQFGKTVIFRWALTWGTTTTFTGAASAGLPFTARAGPFQVASAWYLDNGTRHHVGSAFISPSSALAGLVHAEAGGAGLVANPDPFTWASTDVASVCGTYEIA